MALPPEEAKKFLPAPVARRARLLVANSRLAKVARVAALGADNIRFDHDVVGSADHQQMFDIVASNNNELALPVEVEGIDGPEPRQPGPSITWQQKPAPEGEAEIMDNRPAAARNAIAATAKVRLLLAKKLSIKAGIWWLIRRKLRRAFV